ncbi:CheY-P phosphatase CheC [Salinibacillus aidingensis]|uniref:CheY-P phosphatase CheC n=1 Tax=Salinibacillus aidingensis TaxID=237684 RepID=A0ABP3L941_9BACI
MNDSFSFSSLHLDILKEIGNIGSGNATTSLSALLNRKIQMKVPEVNIVSFDEMMDMTGGPEKEIASIFVKIQGDISGSMFFVLPPHEASMLIREMTGNDDFHFQSPPYSDLAVSAYVELGNILCGSYLSALSDMTNLNIQPSVPSAAFDMVGAILTAGLVEISQVADQAIFIETLLLDEKDQYDQMKGQFFLLPDPNSFDKIFNALGAPR